MCQGEVGSLEHTRDAQLSLKGATKQSKVAGRDGTRSSGFPERNLLEEGTPFIL